MRIPQNLVHGLRYLGNEGHTHHGILIQVPATYHLPDGGHINMIADIYGDGDNDLALLPPLSREPTTLLA
ncbi:MAG: hypothetical protein N3E49_02350 [Bacteroidia bacterium]|nr:hypothetical protein [Bacteroidia bacterium]